LFLYAYYDGQGWQSIPFQIDENDTTAFMPPDGIFDETDELLFLAKDLGDRVHDGIWIPNPDARLKNRYEIEISDGSDYSKKGWCYLFQSTTLTENDKSDVVYVSYNPDDDKVTGKYYIMDHPKKWFPEDVLITAEGGGNGVDFYDRTKLRVILQPTPFPWVLPEDSLVVTDIRVNQNPIIRLRRQLILDLVLQGTPFKQGIEFNMFYYPFSTRFSGGLELEEVYKVKNIRMSYDLNSNAVGMKFYSGDESGLINQNITIDGAGKLDNVNQSLSGNAPNWTMATGNPGTILSLNHIQFEGDTSVTEPYYQDLYYWDDAVDSELPVQHDQDTGDNKSYGDHGMMFSSYSLIGVFTYQSTSYLLPANKSKEVAQTMFNNYLTRIYYASRVQSYSVDVAENPDLGLPQKYSLLPNYPNPFNPATTITFELPQNDGVVLEIFDIHGRSIKILEHSDLKAGMYHYEWDGKDRAGKPVSSGVYIYSMKTTHFQANSKMLLIK